MEKLSKIEFSNQELEGLPLFFKRIYYNSIVSEEDEMKMLQYNERAQSPVSRGYHPGRTICKTFNPIIFKSNEI